MSAIPNTANPADHWRAHLTAWRASGLSQARYCAAHDLKQFNFSYWKKKLEAPTRGGFVEVPILQPPSPRAALLEMRISEAFEFSLTLRLPGTILGRLFGGHVSGR